MVMINIKNIKQPQKFFENIINTVREHLISLDQDLRVVSVSRSFYDFFKLKPEAARVSAPALVFCLKTQTRERRIR